MVSLKRVAHFLLVMFLLLPVVAMAQENKSFLIKAKVKQGSLLLGGSVNASLYSVSDELSNPSLKKEGTVIHAVVQGKNGYFVMHDFVVGLDMTMSHESQNVRAQGTEGRPFRQTQLLAGPFARYYLDNGVFGEISLEAGLLNLSTGQKDNLFEGALGVGYAFFINEKFSLEPTLSFRYFRQTDKDNVYTRLGPMLGFGVQAYILRKRANVIKKAL